jgi:hypothetical protein
MSDASGILSSANASVSADAVSPVSDTIARMSDAAGVLSGDGVMSADTFLAVPHAVARMSDASGVLSASDGGMSVARVSDEDLSVGGGLSNDNTAALPGGDGAPWLWRA